MKRSIDLWLIAYKFHSIDYPTSGEQLILIGAFWMDYILGKAITLVGVIDQGPQWRRDGYDRFWPAT
jgi:hypothetical protein